MIAAVVNHAPGSGKTALAVHLAGELALRGRRVLLADAGLEAGSLRWAEARRRTGHAALFETVGLDRELIAAGRLRRALAGLSDGADPVIVDTPPRPFDRLSEVLAACDLVLLPVPAGGVALSGSRAAIAAALWERRRRTDLGVRVVYTRVRGGIPGAVLAMVNGARLVGTAAALCDEPVLSGVLPAGLLVHEAARGGPAVTCLSAITTELFGRGGG